MNPVYHGMTVCLTDGCTGTVVDVLIDARTGEDRYIVLSVDGYFGPNRVAPFSTVWQVDERAHLALTSHEAAALPLTSHEAAALPRFDATACGEEAGLRSRP